MPIPPRFPRICLSLIFPILLIALAPAARAAGSAGDIYFGYSHLGNNAFYSNAGGLNGWEGTVHVRIMPLVGIEGDVAHYSAGKASVPHTTTVLFGPRVTVGAAGIHLFVHGLVGGEHSANNDPAAPISGGALAIALGGGADVRIAPMLAWRVGADYLDAPTHSPGSGSHDRFTTGLVFRF
jgi:hypothetical protein